MHACPERARVVPLPQYLAFAGALRRVVARWVAVGLGRPVLRPVAFSGPAQCAGFNLRRYGVRGLYAGFSASLLSNPICFGVRFITYEKTCSVVAETMQCAEDKLRLYRSQQPEHVPLTSGAGANARSTASREMIAQIIGGGIAGMATW